MSEAIAAWSEQGCRGHRLVPHEICGTGNPGRHPLELSLSVRVPWQQ
ncbi:hypothetical protein BN2537_14515 [Streptomyces venezuelae]|nr:hypothetical protein BN2537_14515 [Streptomyces venezuelae]